MLAQTPNLQPLEMISQIPKPGHFKYLIGKSINERIFFPHVALSMNKLFSPVIPV